MEEKNSQKNTNKKLDKSDYTEIAKELKLQEVNAATRETTTNVRDDFSKNNQEMSL